MSVDDDPASLAAAASSADAGGAGDAAGDAAGATGDAADEPGSLIEVLLATEPDEDPSEYDLRDDAAHAVIGAKKVLNALGPSVDTGTPAIANFAAAGYLWWTHESGDGSSSSPGDGGGDGGGRNPDWGDI